MAMNELKKLAAMSRGDDIYVYGDTGTIVLPFAKLKALIAQRNGLLAAAECAANFMSSSRHPQSDYFVNELRDAIRNGQ